MLLLRVARLEIEHTRDPFWHTRRLVSRYMVVSLLLLVVTACAARHYDLRVL
jgi:hypothetical protein